MNMRRTFHMLAIAVLVCLTTTTYAQGDYDKYEKDNETYGTTPYINLSDMPVLKNCMPNHPAFNSPEFCYDLIRYNWGKEQRSGERIKIAQADAEWDDLEKVYANWKDAFGLEVTKEGTPAIYAFLNKSLRTTDPTRRDIKAQYHRTRPFEYFNETTASGEDDELRGEGSYPSGHTLRGWTITLLMIQIAPERAEQLYQRGMDYGFSRVIVGAHWQSDVDNSRMGASMLFSVLQSNADFRADLQKAQQEYKEKIVSSIPTVPAKAGKHAANIYKLDGTPANEQTHGVVIENNKKAVKK